MSRNFRNFLWFLFGCIIAAVPLLAEAETISSSTYRFVRFNKYSAPTVYGTWVQFDMSASSTEFYSVGCPASVGGYYVPGKGCNSTPTGSGSGNISYEIQQNTGPGCPLNQNWTLSGQVCTRPDCAPDQIRDENGICRSSCPDGEIQEGDSCVCPFRHERNESGVCELKCPHPKGYRPAGLDYVSGSGAIPDSACVDNCVFNTGMCAALGGTWACDVGPSTGNTCSLPSDPPGPEPEPGDPPPPPPAEPLSKDSPEYDCASKGMASGTVNGQTVCVPASETKSTNNTEQKITRPDGSVGKETTETTTRCSGSDCVTTSTTTISGGGSTGTKEDGTTVTETSGKGACEENPSAPQCKPDEPEFDRPGTGSFEGKGDEVAAAQQAVAAKIEQIKNQVASMFGALGTGGGGLSCDSGVPINALGTNFNLCFASQEGNLHPLQVAVLVIAALAALLIIFR